MDGTTGGQAEVKKTMGGTGKYPRVTNHVSL